MRRSGSANPCSAALAVLVSAAVASAPVAAKAEQAVAPAPSVPLEVPLPARPLPPRLRPLADYKALGGEYAERANEIERLRARRKTGAVTTAVLFGVADITAGIALNARSVFQADCDSGVQDSCDSREPAEVVAIGAGIVAFVSLLAFLKFAVGDTSEIRSKTAELNAMTQLLQPQPSLADLPEYQFLRQPTAPGAAPLQPSAPAPAASH